LLYFRWKKICTLPEARHVISSPLLCIDLQ